MSMTMLNVPVGTVIDFAGPTAPDGYLECDGSAISRTTYAVLFSIIGTSWGTGDGSTTFNLPDLRGRTTIGDGTGTAGGATAHAFASTGGDERMPSHAHGHTNPTVQLPNHTHAHTNPTVTLPNHTHAHTNPTVTLPNHVHSMAHTHGLNNGNNRYVGYNYSVVKAGVTVARVAASTSGTNYVPKVANSDVDFSGSAATAGSSAANTGNPTSLPNCSISGGGVGNPSSLPNCSVSGGSVGNPSSLPNCTVSGGGVSSNGDGTAGNMQPFATLKKLIRAA